MLLFDPSYNTNVHPSHVLIFCVQGTTLNMIPSMQFALSGLLDHWLHNTDSDVADQGLWDEILMSIMHAQTQAQIRQVCSCLQSLFLNFQTCRSPPWPLTVDDTQREDHHHNESLHLARLLGSAVCTDSWEGKGRLYTEISQV